MPDPRLDERGCAYVVPRDPQNPPTLAGICAYLEAEGLAKYKWPERLELIDALPRTQIGKVSKVTLRADISAKLEHETTPAQARRHGVSGGTGRGRDCCYEVHRAFCGSHLPRTVASRSRSRNGVTVAMASSSVRAFGRRERAASAA